MPTWGAHCRYVSNVLARHGRRARHGGGRHAGSDGGVRGAGRDVLATGGALTSAFDKTTSEVRIEIPSTFFHDLPAHGPVLSPGAKISGLAITARRNDADVLVPNTDEAGSLGCDFVLTERR